MEISSTTQSDLSSLPDPTKSYENKYDEHFALAAGESTMEVYWAEQAKVLDWYKEPDVILDKSNAPLYSWYRGGMLNVSYNCIDRHAKKAPSRKALIYENNFGLPTVECTYSELLYYVSRLASVFLKHGIKKGDVVMIYMPNIMEGVFSILACARIGALHYALFDSIGGDMLVKLINDTQPKLFIAASCSLSDGKIVNRKAALDDALKQSTLSTVKKIVVQREIQKVQLIEGEEFDFYEELSQADAADPVPLSATDPLFILNTSRSTGKPKGLVYHNGSYAVAHRYLASNILDIREGDVAITDSEISWGSGMALMYASLLAGATCMFLAPDSTGLVWKLCDKYKVKVIMTRPFSIRALKNNDPDANYMKKADLSSLKLLAYVGEKMDITTYKWLKNNLPNSCNLSEIYAQSEATFALAVNLQGIHVFPYREGSSYKPFPGMRIAILDEENQTQAVGKPGRICIKHPLPLGGGSVFSNKEAAFKENVLSTCPGYHVTGDMGFFDKDGYLYVTGREDDSIKVCAALVNAIELEEILCKHPDVAEAGVAAAIDEKKSDIPVGFIILKKDTTRDVKEIEEECKKKIDLATGFYLSKCITVNELPKTRSGKVLRRVLKYLLQGEDFQIPETCCNPNVVDSLRLRVNENGFGKKGIIS